MKIFHSMGHVVGGTLLIAGTTIGVGMLALPVATGPAGFIPSIAVYLLCWIFMLCTGFALVEVCLWMPKETSFISMATKIFGTPGKIVFWFMYLFLFISVMIAHVAGGADSFKDILGIDLPQWVYAIVYTAIIAPSVYMGTRSVDRLNMVLISGVIISFLAFIYTSVSAVDVELLKFANWNKVWFAIPVLFTAFTYQVIIPSLMNYMDQNVRKVRLSIFFGSAIPLIVYLTWEFLILGIVPVDGPNGLIEAEAAGQNAVMPLKQFLSNPLIFDIGKYFAFFALTTTFIPFSLAFDDFLADGLKWQKTGLKKLILCLLVFGIPLIITLKYPQIFLIALSYAGGISCAFLFGLMPPLMVWVGRYILKLPKNEGRLLGGKALLALLISFSFCIVIGQFFNLFF